MNSQFFEMKRTQTHLLTNHSKYKSLSPIRLRPMVAACCLLALLVVSARAIDRHVPSASYATIADAVAAAQAGDRILVGAGVYQENVVSTNANIQFIGH